MFNKLSAFMQNPMAFFKGSKFNIPQEIRNPDEMINYLLQSGQLSQDQYNQVYSEYRNVQGSGELSSLFKWFT